MKENIHSWNKGTILQAVQTFIDKNGRLPTAREMNPQNSLPNRRTFQQALGTSFYEYMKEHYPELTEYAAKRHKEAVLNYRKERQIWDKERLMKAEKEFALEYGRLPQPHEYKPEHGLPSYTIFCKIAEAEFTEFLKRELRLTLNEGLKDGSEQEEPVLQMKMM